jgi:hypothetical protein
MLYKTLNRRNKNFKLDKLLDLQALYTGEVSERITSFVPQAKIDDSSRFQAKCRVAIMGYRNYFAEIVDYYTGFLFQNPIAFRPMQDDKPIDNIDSFYSLFQTDCDGSRKGFQDFLSERFSDLSVYGSAFWVVQFPGLDIDVNNRLDWEALGAGRGTVFPFSPLEVCDYLLDSAGNLEWIRFNKTDYNMALDPLNEQTYTRERYWVYTKSECIEFALTYPNNQLAPDQGVPDNTDIPEVARFKHGFSSVPVVMMQVPKNQPGLGGKLFAPQVDSLNARLRKVFGLNTFAYPITVFKTITTDLDKCLSSTGIQVAPGDDVSLLTPADVALKHMADDEESCKQEMHRIASVFFMGIDGNAYGLSRSAQARTIDIQQGAVSLKNFAKVVTEAAERTFALLADYRKDKLQFSAEGFDQLDANTLDSLVKSATAIVALPKYPITGVQELYKRINLKVCPDADPSVKEDIEDEIEQITEIDPVVINPSPATAVERAPTDSKDNPQA